MFRSCHKYYYNCLFPAHGNKIHTKYCIQGRGHSDVLVYTCINIGSNYPTNVNFPQENIMNKHFTQFHNKFDPLNLLKKNTPFFEIQCFQDPNRKMQERPFFTPFFYLFIHVYTNKSEWFPQVLYNPTFLCTDIFMVCCSNNNFAGCYLCLGETRQTFCPYAIWSTSSPSLQDASLTVTCSKITTVATGPYLVHW